MKNNSAKTTSIMIVGVGGQGSLLASRILGAAATEEGYEVKVSEVHGMSQRGGSVVTYVKYGEKIYSPIIMRGEADVIISFEIMEAYRALPYLKKGGVVISSTQRISPMPVITGDMGYNEDIEGKIRAAGIKLILLDALSLAKEAGSDKAPNVVLIGALAKQRGEDKKKLYMDALEKSINPKFFEINSRAFELGYNYSV